MKIAVCVKAVPDTESKIKPNADSSNVDFAGVRFIASPYDEFAIEEALKLKEKYGGETVVFSLGAAEVTDVLRDSLARGIDSAVHIQDAALENADTLSIAKTLAAAIKEGAFDLVICGQQGVGNDNSQVPSMLAEFLDLPQATMVVKLDIDDNKFRAQREIEGAHEIIEGTLPAVVSAQKGLNEPRYPSIKGVMAARRKEILVKDLAVLQLAAVVGQGHAKSKIKKVVPPPERPQGKMIEGDPETQAKELAKLLRSEAKVI